jgi:hypothetical protein
VNDAGLNTATSQASQKEGGLPQVVSVRGSTVALSSNRSSAENSGSDLSDSILKGHNRGENTNDSILLQIIGTWVHSKGFKAQKFVLKNEYNERSPLFYYCMKANLPGFVESRSAI